MVTGNYPFLALISSFFFLHFRTLSKVHISSATRNALKGEFALEEAFGRMRNKTLDENNMDTYFIVGYAEKPSLASVGTHGSISLETHYHTLCLGL